MASGMIDIIKRAALDAVDNAKLTDLRFGTVISASPLQVRVTNQFVLTEQMLIVPHHLSNYTITVDVDWTTDEAGGHAHKVEGERTMKVYNALQVGDKVALLRKQGGQSYFILDRLQK